MKSTFRLRPLQGAVLLALASTSPLSHALRLGEPVVKSYVGQPLVAEFAIEETTPEELRRLQISLATPSLFNNMRAVFHPSLKTSSLAILNRDGQTPKLVLRTDGPVEDSVVDIVFELTWAAGRMIQSSTVLIDPAPAGVAIDTPAFQASPVVVVETPKPSTPAVGSGVLNATNLPPLEKVGPQTVLVKKGDTLSKIATRMAMPDVKLEQLLVALYNKNSKAIASKNVNLIREGTILALPTKQEALAVDASQAMKTVALHASNFRAYAQNLAQQSASSTSRNSGVRSQTGNVTSEIIERAAPEGKDQVRIGAGEEGSTQGQASKIQLDNLKAENASRQQELDKNLQDLAALARLKNEQLAKMQERMNAGKGKPVEKQPEGLLPPPEKNTTPVPAAPVSEPVASAAMPTTPAAIVKPEAMIEQDKVRAEAPKLSSTIASSKAASPTPVQSSPPGSPIVETPMLPDTLRPNASISGPNALESEKFLEDAPKPKASAPAPAKAAPKEIKPVAKASPPPAPAPENDWMDMLPAAAGGVGVLALLGGWLYTRRKKKIDPVEESEEDSVVQEAAPAVFSLDFPPSELPVDADEVQYQESQSILGHEEQADVAMDELDQALHDNGMLLDIGGQDDARTINIDTPYVAPTHFVEVPVSDMPVVEPVQEDNPFAGHDLNTELPESGEFGFEFNPDENTELENLTRSLAQGMPSLDEPTPESDKAAYAVSLTYDPDEQLGIAKFYLGLQDFRGVWDMVTPLLDHERDDIKAQAHDLLESIPEEMRDEWNASK